MWSFRMRILLALAVLAAAAPAFAAQTTYDAFTSFSATPGHSGAFTYGSFDVATAVFTPFAAGGTCNTPDTICQSANQLPAVFKTTAGTFVYSTATVPADALILHPGSNTDESNSVAIVFTAPRAGVYTFSGTAAVSDTMPSGTNLYGYAPASGAPVVEIASLSSATPSFSASPTLTLARGDTAALIIGNGGDYRDDSTAVNLSATVAGVPEAGTWAMMIAGIAMVGAASRRRRITVAA